MILCQEFETSSMCVLVIVAKEEAERAFRFTPADEFSISIPSQLGLRIKERRANCSVLIRCVPFTRECCELGFGHYQETL